MTPTRTYCAPMLGETYLQKYTGMVNHFGGFLTVVRGYLLLVLPEQYTPRMIAPGATWREVEITGLLTDFHA